MASKKKKNKLILDRNKTLTSLEKNDWGEPPDISDLVSDCYRLRNKPLKDFTLEDLNTMLGQVFSLKYLIPLALDRLEENPLAEGGFYDGGLLDTVLGIKTDSGSDPQVTRQKRSELATFWSKNKVLRQRAVEIANRAKIILEKGEVSDAGGHLMKAIPIFVADS